MPYIHGTEIASSCKLPNMSAGNGTEVHQKRHTYSETLLKSQYLYFFFIELYKQNGGLGWFLKKLLFIEKRVLNPDYHIDGKGGELVDQVVKP